MCFGHIHFLMLTLGTTRDTVNRALNLYKFNCTSSTKTENSSYAVHNLLAERDCKS